MLLLKLLEESDSEVVYSYFPEKKKYFGTVKINKIMPAINVIKAALSWSSLKRNITIAILIKKITATIEEKV